MSSTVYIKRTQLGKVAIWNLPVFAKKKGAYWFAYTPHVKVLGYSKRSKKEAIKDWKKSADLFFNIHLKRDSLEAALYHFGWASEPTSKDVFKHPKYTDIPTHLLASQESGSYQYKRA